MITQITHISVLQTSKVLAVVYGVVGLVYIPLGMAIDAASAPDERLGMFWVAAPVILAALGFVVAALGCAIYNFIARRMGGVEFTLTHGGAADPM